MGNIYMEDLNTLGADCIVISCCCQCLVLQILLLVLIKLPYKLVRKTRRYVKRKFCGKKRNNGRKKVNNNNREIIMGSYYYKDVIVRSIVHEESIRKIEEEMMMMMEIRDDDDSISRRNNNCGSCIDEVEKVMRELYENGELVFGSFWGRKGSFGVPTRNNVTNHHINFGDGFIRYEIVELVDDDDSLDFV